MNMSFYKIFQSIIHHETFTDQQKKAYIVKALQHIGTQTLTYEEALPIFAICLPTALENSNKVAVLSLYVYTVWGNKYPNYLQRYLTIETITDALLEKDSLKLNIILTWLKEGLQILHSDVDYICSIRTILAGILETKFIENGRISSILSQISELYILCPDLLPFQNLRLKFTISIMHCVASFPTPTKPETLKHMKNLGDLITMLWETLQLEDILSTLISMYSIISNTDTSVEVCPAMAHILSLVFPQVVEGLGPRIVADPQSSNEAFEATLVRLCSWLITWPTAHVTLVHWIRTLVRLLYKCGRNIVPARITYDQILKLFDGLRIPVCRPGVLAVAKLLLMSFQYSPVAFHKVIGNIISMIDCLENECSESSKVTIQGLVTLCHAQMALYPGHPETYQNLMEVLKNYETPSDEEIRTLIQEHNWVAIVRDGNRFLNSGKSLSKLLGPSMVDTSMLTYYKRTHEQKVGLRNLGNTCYMNSVIQALFMTDDFRHSVLHSYPKSNQQLLVKLQHLLTSLCFSHRSHISPRTFHDTSRPPWFSPGMQHDCSEYLRHLMITLHEEERSGQKLPEYQERMIVESETTSLASDLQALPEDNYQTQLPDSITVDIQETLKSPCKSEEKNFQDPLLMEHLHDSFNDVSCGATSKDNAETNTYYEHECKMRKLGTNKESSRDADRDSGSFYESVKRKHDISTVESQYTRSKSPKGESSTITSETDNSSDSGISGDLAEELDFQNTHKMDETVPEDKSLCIQEMNDTMENDYFVSQVHKIFGGKISTSIKCLNCKTESIHKDAFTDINLAFQDCDQNNAASTIRKQPERLCKQKQGETVADLKIEDMIANFLTSERLTGENQYECDRCGSKQDAERSLEIIETPDHLILTQLRFFYDTSKGQRQKVFTNVDFGEELLFPMNGKPIEILNEDACSDSGVKIDISCIEETKEELVLVDDKAEVMYDKYALYGVVVHSGFSSEGGHYYCYARNSSLAGLPQSENERNEDGGEWFNFNDERVTKTNFCAISRLTKTFTRDTAYVLFYRKVDLANGMSSSKVPLFENLSSLRQELQDVLEAENLQYRSEQEAEALRKRISKSAAAILSSYPKDDDGDPPPPPPAGGTCGDGNGLSITSREIF